MVSLFPFILPTVYILVNILVFNKLKEDNTMSVDQTAYWIKMLFPIYISFGIILSTGLFATTIVADREQKLRYLLNFAGMRSSSYFWGFVFADWFVFMVPQIFLLATIFIARIDEFIPHLGPFYMTLCFYGFSFVSMSYLWSFIF